MIKIRKLKLDGFMSFGLNFYFGAKESAFQVNILFWSFLVNIVYGGIDEAQD